MRFKIVEILIENRLVLNNFIEGIKIVLIHNPLDLYAVEKVRLRIKGNTYWNLIKNHQTRLPN